MVGRREKPALPRAYSEFHLSSGSTIRRKISNGLAFFAHPLSQRKITPPDHIQVKGTSTVAPDQFTASETTQLLERHSPVLTTHQSNAVIDKALPPPPAETPTATVTEHFISVERPKPLPRSQTLSFTPRPVRITSVSSSISPIQESPEARRHGAHTNENALPTPSKIPSPSPPLSHRRISPRQYKPNNTPAGSENATPTHYSKRKSSLNAAISTPARANGAKPHPLSLARQHSSVPRLASSGSSTFKTKLSTHTENTPISTQKRSLTHAPKASPEAMASPCTRPKRLSNKSTVSRSGNLLAGSRDSENSHTVRSTLPAQNTPRTIRGQLPNNSQSLQDVRLPDDRRDSKISQPRLMGPMEPPTPTIDIPMPPLTRTSNERETQRRRLGTPMGLGGVWRTSRALGAANHEVSKIPRSQTMHDLGMHTRTRTPPVPTMPSQYRAPSLFHLPNFSREYLSKDTEEESCPSTSDAQDHEDSTLGDRDWSQHHNDLKSKSRDIEKRLQAIKERVRVMRRSAQSSSTFCSESDERQRNSYSASDDLMCSLRMVPSIVADNDSLVQVKDYMPPLYWAGRFSSRVDEWRNQAMEAELDSSFKPVGDLGGCTLDQEKLASCLIFKQLRDLCISEQAADSLHDFEYNYRKENKLFGDPVNMPPMPARKIRNHSTQQGSVTRAIRKLTPRKSSLVNLLKGKSWNKGEDGKGKDSSERVISTDSHDS